MEVPSEGLDADLAATNAFFATRPAYERPFATGFEKVPGLVDLSARTCAACHPDTHGEWSASVHAQAWVDPQYQAEIGKSDNRWLCLNCHTPLLTQQDKWPRGLVDEDVERPIWAANPAFDAELREEGITCAACHVREGAIAGPGRAKEAPHPLVVDPDLSSGALCRRCHDVQATYPGKNFICTFETGAELDAGPWAAEGATCVSCHMPRGEKSAHWWRGAGIPKLADGPYPPPEANPFGLAMQAEVVEGSLHLKLTNANAGHKLPTGDPERWVQVDVGMIDEEGATLASEELRIGQVWSWDPPTKESDNRLGPRESRVEIIELPDWVKRVVVVASNHRISKENAEYHELGSYPRSVEVGRLEVALP